MERTRELRMLLKKNKFDGAEDVMEFLNAMTTQEIHAFVFLQCCELMDAGVTPQALYDSIQEIFAEISAKISTKVSG